MAGAKQQQQTQIDDLCHEKTEYLPIKTGKEIGSVQLGELKKRRNIQDWLTKRKKKKKKVKKKSKREKKAYLETALCK